MDNTGIGFICQALAVPTMMNIFCLFITPDDLPEI